MGDSAQEWHERCCSCRRQCERSSGDSPRSGRFRRLSFSGEVAFPRVSSKRCTDADGGKKKKRKIKSRPEAATTAKRRSKAATSERDLPRGVYKTSSGKYESQIRWGGKKRHIGTFDTPEQASAAYMSVRKDLDDAKLRPCGSDDNKKAAEIDVVFDVAKKKALEAVADST